MRVLPILAAGFFMNAAAVLFVVCGIALILVVLIQKGKGGGLSGVFGGGAAGGVLGTKVGDFLTWFTIGLACLLILLAVVLGKWFKPTVSDYGGGQGQRTSAPAEQPEGVDGNLSEVNIPEIN